MTVSVKSLQKQLIAAVAMVLVAMIALGSSTYAWFASNTKVEATGANVTATTVKALLIDTTNFGGLSTVPLAADNNPAAAMWPVTDTNDTSNKVLTFTKLTSDQMTKVAANGTTSETAATSTTEDYFHDTVYLKLDGEGTGATETIKVTPTMSYTGGSSGTAKDIYKAVHVAVYDVAAGSFIEFDMGSASLGTAVSAQDLGTLSYNTTASQYEVYAWIDGPDENCFNANTGSLQNFSINLAFEIK